MRLQKSSRVWAWTAVCLLLAQVLASAFLHKSPLLATITDAICFLLLASASVAFARNAFGTSRRQRVVWSLLGLGYAVETCGQVEWMYWDLVRKQTPVMYLGDACIFFAWIALILGFALRPHVEPTKQERRLGTLDLLLLLLTGIYLYLFLVIPWQYLVPDPRAYGLADKFLSLAQDVILLSIVILGWRQSLGRWRQFYALLTAIVAVDVVMEYIVDTIANSGSYFSGGWYDLTTAAGIAGMTWAAILGRGLHAAPEHRDRAADRYWRWASRLAAPVTLFLPLLAAWSALDRALPPPVARFRVLLSLAAIVVFGLVGILKQVRLESELADANQELLDASLTDLLTGVRNRRFFTNSIEADVQQVLRSFAGSTPTDTRNRDLVFYLIDIDHFKKVNDEFGHQIGDQILIEIARRINSAARLSDAVIRWGGEEFLLLSRHTDRKEAQVLAKRVLDAVGTRPYPLEGSDTEISVTCSVGWAAFPWIEADPRSVSHDRVLVLADYALYQAKGGGRNRAVGLLPAREAVRDGMVATTFYVSEIPASPVTTLGPGLEQAAAAAAVE